MIKKIFRKISWSVFRKSYPVKEFYLYRDNRKNFFKKVMDPSFPWKNYKGSNPYFKKWGFDFPMYETEYYCQNTGVRSDLYLPISFYKRYVFPYLDHDSWHWGYADKNMFSRLLAIEEAQKHVDVMIPECVVCCDNGRYYKGNLIPSTQEEIIKVLCDVDEDLIIKPSVESSHGKGVAKILKEEKTAAYLEELIAQYGANFTVQKVLVQHPDLAAFNETSVNTIRITTYQDFNGKVKILYASQRFGGKGKVYDNADDPNGSGGFCAIEDDGTVKREIHHYRNMKVTRLDDSAPARIPYYDKVKEAVLFMHTRFPHFALIGWDVSVTPDGHPVIIEYNFCPGIGTGQLANGPLFSKEDLDEIMKRVSKAKLSIRAKERISFPDKPKYWTR